jgi:arginase
MSTPKAQGPVSIINVPLDLGAKNLGVDSGPDAFRHAGIVDKLTSTGLKVHDEQTIEIADRESLNPGDPHLRYADEILRVSGESAKLTTEAISAGRRVVGLGGDHSLTLGLVSGASAAVEGELGLIYFDAHGDMNTATTTLTGNIHGMHVAGLLGFEPALAAVHTKNRKIQPANFLHIGGSDFDQAEHDLIAREHLTTFSLFDLLSGGLAPLIKLIDDLVGRVPNIYVSLDLDSIDRQYAPGAGMPNAKGLLYREIATIAEYIGAHANVVAVDVVEYNPFQDENAKTAELGIELIAKFFGHNYSWYSNYLNRNQLSS